VLFGFNTEDTEKGHRGHGECIVELEIEIEKKSLPLGEFQI